MWLCICSARWFEETFENTSVTMHLLREDIKTKNFSIRALRAIATLFLFGQVIWGHIWKKQWRNVNQMQPVWICIFSFRQFEATFENTRWRKVNQCDYASSKTSHLRKHLKTHSGEKSNKCSQCNFISFQPGNLRTHLKTQWRNVNEMQPLWICIFSWRQFEVTFENTLWRKVNQMQPVWLCIF